MPYDLQTMALLTNPPHTNVPNIWGYVTAVNTIAEVSASGYFDDETRLVVNDAIRANCSDGTAWLRVASLEPTTVVNDLNEVSNLQDGYIWVGDVSNNAVPTPIEDAINDVLEAESLLQYAAVPITAAEFNGMYVAPKLLVAAAGANTLLVLDKVVLAMTYNSAAYAAGGAVHVQYDDTTLGAGVICSNTLAAASFQGVASLSIPLDNLTAEYPFATTVNQGLYLSNITGAFTTGNSPMVAHVWYKTIPTV